MHPNRAFHADPAAGRALFAELMFATLSAGGALAHAPVVVAGEELWFHLARPNPAAAGLAGGRAILCALDPGTYVTPDWYADRRDAVPTWNYRAAEAEGRVRALTRAELLRQLDLLAAAGEPRVGGGWTRAKLSEIGHAALLRGIHGFALQPDTWRVTLKDSGNKTPADRAGVRAGLLAAGRVDAARWTA